MTPLDPATVRRCIEALKGTGRYDKQWKRLSDMDEPDLIESWTYTTHPMDILAALLKPEPTEAEKLVDAWMGGNMDGDDQDYVRLAQFILDKQAQNPAEVLRDIATDFAEQHGYTVDQQSFAAGAAYCAATEPQYVYGPWIIHPDGNAPVIPEGWKYQLRGRTTGRVHNEILTGPDTAQTWSATDYRLRFEAGKWYDWTGGDCPVGGHVMVTYELRKYGFDESGPWCAKRLDWAHPTQWGAAMDIIKFKIVAP